MTNITKEEELETITINNFPIHTPNYFQNKQNIRIELIGIAEIELKDTLVERAINGLLGLGFGSTTNQGYNYIEKEAKKINADFAILNELGPNTTTVQGLFGPFEANVTKISADLYKNLIK